MRKLLISLALCLGAGGVGAAFTMQSVDTWYTMLKKPFFTPPNWVFTAVWSVLYILMGFSLAVVWQKRRRAGGHTLSFILFGIQLALNITWSIVFFGYCSLSGGLFIMVFLWLALVATIHEFLYQSQAAGLLLIPYLVWVSYASFINWSIWLLNK